MDEKSIKMDELLYYNSASTIFGIFGMVINITDTIICIKKMNLNVQIQHLYHDSTQNKCHPCFIATIVL